MFVFLQNFLLIFLTFKYCRQILLEFFQKCFKILKIFKIIIDFSKNCLILFIIFCKMY